MKKVTFAPDLITIVPLNYVNIGPFDSYGLLLNFKNDL